MRKSALAMACCAALMTLAACSGSDSPVTDPTSSAAATTKAPDISEHESGPESPIAYGMEVPSGATQLGPLVRFRSAALIAAYQPELDAAVAQREAEQAEKIAEDEREGTPSPTPTPTLDTRPSPDTFKLLEDEPSPDSSISLMRIDGKPSIVVRRMVAQIAAAVPTADITTNDLSTYCTSVENRVASCRLDVTGATKNDRDIRIVMTVDPGNIVTRTAPPSAMERPVMTLSVEYVGEPRKGQLSKPSNDLDGVQKVTSNGDTSGLIWPRMDLDAPPTTKLVKGWVAPGNATILLSGFDPKFVIMTTKKAADGDLIAEDFAKTRGVNGVFAKDVVEDLNEVSTTYTATAADGSIARSIYVLSARGNYTMLFYYPAN